MYYNQDAISLSDSAKDYLTALESELQIPIRVLNGDWEGRYSPPSWDQEQADACAIDLPTAQNSGITIAMWSSGTDGQHTTNQTIPGWFYQDGNDRPALIYDFLAPGTTPIAEAIKTDADFPYCEVGERTVWHFFHFDETMLPDGDQINYDRFFKEPILKCIDEELNERLASIRINQSKNEFLEICSSRISLQIDNHRNDITSREEQVRGFSSQLTSVLQSLAESRDNLDRIVARRNQRSEHWEKEWEALNRHPRIQSIMLSDGVVDIETDPITMTHPDDSSKSVLLGRFRIKMNMNDNRIHMKNLDNPKRNRDHPHIQREVPCFGGHETTISKLQAEGEIAALYEVLIQYLESYNPDDDWGRYAEWWFETAEQDAQQNSPEVAVT